MPDVEVLIIGAGAAGTGAFHELRAAGIHTRIIEARQRTGGRAWTVALTPGVPFDVGASWIHGVEAGNPFVELGHAAGFRIEQDPRTRLFVRADGSTDQRASTRFEATFAALCARVDARLADPNLADLSLADATAGMEAEPEALQARTLAANWFFGAEALELDLRDWQSTAPGRDWLVREGYGTLVAHLARRMPVELGCVAQSLEISGTAIEVRTNRGSIRAGEIILTIPLGVLASGRIAFEPRLDVTLERAIEGLPMGVLTKVGIAIDDRRFPLEGSHLLHLPDCCAGQLLFYLRPCGLPILYGLVGGALARQLEEDGKEATIAIMRDAIRETFGATAGRALGPADASSWSRDPYSLGSYTHAAPGHAQARLALAHPVMERLWFAGEANAPGGFQATVGGAYLAGRDQARKIAAKLRPHLRH